MDDSFWQWPETAIALSIIGLVLIIIGLSIKIYLGRR